VLILDDCGLEPLDAAARHDLLEILEERCGRRSTIVTSQLPVDRWHEIIADPTYADTILDHSFTTPTARYSGKLLSSRSVRRFGTTSPAQMHGASNGQNLTLGTRLEGQTVGTIRVVCSTSSHP
jgi:hypothetical protein